MHSIRALLSFASLLAFIKTATAGFSASASNNVAIYWGQNSYGQGTGAYAQQRLGYYCANSEFNTVQLSFLITIANPSLNFANAGDNCTLFPGTNLFNCPQLAEDIATCQNTYGKTILLSIGGATYSEGGFPDSTSAVNAANNIWSIFGPPKAGSTVNRPFGSASVDGFDFDFESGVQNVVPFANQLRSLMDASSGSTGKKYFLTAAPQCPYPDSADNAMLSGAVFFDAIWVQFYNNYCGLQSFVPGASTQNNFNFQTWDNWAKTVSKNPNVKVLLGIPGNTGAAGSGYETGSNLASIIAYCQQFSSFGGVMSWDMSQIYANPGFLDGVHADLGGGGGVFVSSSTSSTMMTTTAPTSTLITTTKSAPATTTTPAGGSGTVPQWGQCGGNGYTGSTACMAPYRCVTLSVWWAQCE